MEPGQKRSPGKSLSRSMVWFAFAVVLSALIGLGCRQISSLPFLVTITPLPTHTAPPTSTLANIPAPTQTLSPTMAPTFTLTPAPEAEAALTRVSEIDGMVQVYVPEGEFEMGSTDGDPDEAPVHTVYLDGYWIDQTEVTIAMYATCMEADVCSEPYITTSIEGDSYLNNPVYDDYPVIAVDWFQAAAYCEWAGRRLPTEAEWEKAARGTDGRTYPWGEAINCDLANHEDNTTTDDFCVGDSSPVGSYPNGASPYGVLDMAGNLWEWTADWYAEDYYAVSPPENPPGSPDGEQYVIRGGSWLLTAKTARSANRERMEPEVIMFDLGFRCAQSEPSP